jgi:hypothetical protein
MGRDLPQRYGDDERLIVTVGLTGRQNEGVRVETLRRPMTNLAAHVGIGHQAGERHQQDLFAQHEMTHQLIVHPAASGDDLHHPIGKRQHLSDKKHDRVPGDVVSVLPLHGRFRALIVRRLWATPDGPWIKCAGIVLGRAAVSPAKRRDCLLFLRFSRNLDCRAFGRKESDLSPVSAEVADEDGDGDAEQ